MNSKSILKTGMWRAILEMKGQELPFTFEVKIPLDKGEEIEIINAEERIKVDEVEIRDDSIFIKPPIFDTEIKAKIKGDALEGIWTDYSRKGNYVIPFKAEFGKSYRFVVGEKAMADISGKWEVTFWGDTSKAVGDFIQRDTHLKGTFLTETGDYRYLEGTIYRDTMKLSCFDGSHAFLFHAVIKNDSLLEGEFWSGTHHYEKWTAVKNENAALRSPDSLTFLKAGYDKLTFTFPNTDSQIVSLADERFTGKVVIVQILGTWCPNCMDETEFLSDFYKRNKEKGIEVIGLAYERTVDFSRVKNNLQRLKKRFDVQYEILFAGSNKLEEAAKTLPMLNHIMSYPTTVFIDKRGQVRKIHTGYSGPATGKHYEEFVKDFEGFVNQLAQE